MTVPTPGEAGSPSPDSTLADPLAFLSGGGEAERMIRARDWTGHPLGAPETWPEALRAALSLVLNSPESMILAWGPELSFFFNDTYFPLLGPRLPWAMGERFDKVWADAWVQAKPIIDEAFAGRSRHFDDLPWKLGTDRGAQDTWWSFSYSRVLDGRGEVAGLFIFTNETTGRVLTDQALAESEARLTRAQEAGGVGLFAVDIPSDVLLPTPEFCRLYGLPVADRYPASMIEAQILPEDRHLVSTAATCNRGEARREVEYRIHPVGSDEVRWVARTGEIEFDEAGRPVRFVGAARDVTERRAIEAERDRSTEALRALNETLESQVAERTADRNALWQLSSDIMLRCTFAGVMTAVNPAWTEVLGWREDELLGSNLFDLIHPDDMARTVEGARQLSYGTGHARFDNRYRHRDGSYRWISWSTRPAEGLINAVGRDFTAERESEAVLRDTRDFARLALGAVGGVGVWTYEVASDLFSYDDAIAKVYALDPARGPSGVPRAEFLANVHPDDRAALRATMAGGLVHPGDLELEYRLVHPDGSVHWVLSRGHTYHDVEGRPVRRTGVGVDMTKQRQTEEALRQSQKMEAVGQLTGGLAHDFNNLLAGISGALELMHTRMTQGRLDDVERYIVAAQGASKRAAALTHRLLAFSRRQTLDPKPTNVNRLVGGLEELLRRTIGPAVTLEVVGAGGLWTTLVDPSQLENALLNLCINARDAMPDGGRITIETANKWLDDHAARKHDMPPGQYLSLCVTDTGAGMSPDVIAKAFDPFFTTKPIGQGTGLGLSMIYGFARQSGGQVRIYSEVGQGTTVCLYLPRHHGEGEVEEGPAPAGRVAPAEQGETVLIVDDEAMIRMLLVDELQGLGYATIEAADSATGLKVLQSDRRVDLVITDVGLPGGMNGRQMADAGQATRPGLKVLFITGYAENAVVGNGQLGPGMQVVTKPFVLEALVARIKEMMAR